MATFIILPDGTDTPNQWQNPGQFVCVYDDVGTNNGDTNYCKESSNSHEVTFTMAAPSVAEADISSITSIQIIMSAAYTAGSGRSTTVRSYLGGSSISTGYNTHGIATGGIYATYSGAVEICSNVLGSCDDWTYADLGNLEIKLDKIFNTAAGTEVRVSYLYALVTYVPVSVGYENEVIGIDSDDISTINGIATADISKVNGV